jgi:hypothetical protein
MKQAPETSYSRQVYRQAWRENDLKWAHANNKAGWSERHKQYEEVRRLVANVMARAPIAIRHPTLVKALRAFWQTQKRTRAVARNLRELDLAKVE